MKDVISNGVGGLHNTLLHPFCEKGVQNPASPLESTRILHPFPDTEEKRGENENLKPNQAGLQTRGRGGGKKGKRRGPRFEKEGAPTFAPSAPAPGFRAPGGFGADVRRVRLQRGESARVAPPDRRESVGAQTPRAAETPSEPADSPGAGDLEWVAGRNLPNDKVLRSDVPTPTGDPARRRMKDSDRTFAREMPGWNGGPSATAVGGVRAG
jgi:hypothetical protein